jgi:hypothetical protein
MRKRIICPQGGGGNWLKNLVLMLESGKYSKPTTQDIFYDNIVVSSNIGICHSIVSFDDPIFISNKRFNSYANVVTKVIYSGLDKENYSNFRKRTFLQQLNALINTASFWLNDGTRNCDFYSHADKDVFVLEYENIFMSPKTFVNELYTLLDKFELNYHKNDDIVYAAITDYIWSCNDVFKMYYNFSNIAWLAWCVAILDRDNIHVGDVFATLNVTDLSNLLNPYYDLLNKESSKWMIIKQ